MRLRFPLAAKILAWSFANLALLAIVALIFAQQKLRFGLDSLVAGPAGDRLRAVAVLVVQELRDLPRNDWNGVLEKFGREYRVRLYLFAENGMEIAGAPVALPAKVTERLRERGDPQRRPPPRPGAMAPPDDESGPPPRERRPPQRPPAVIALLHAGEPQRYWALLHAPLPRLGPDGPALLVLESDSLAAGGLIFDIQPLLWSVAAVIVVSVLFWIPLIRGITRSIASMRSATARIAEGHFDSAIDVSRRDELGALGVAINTMSERLAGLLHGQRRFLTDVAHELCAPLSRLQLALGILEERAGEHEVDKLRDVREEVDQIAGLVNELLSFSRASFGTKKIQLRAVNLREILDQAVHRESTDPSSVVIACEKRLVALADPDLLLRAVSNLLRNAIRHAAHAGPIDLTATARGTQVAIAISDRGPGIPAAALPQIFDPFYRIDTSRTRETGGVGLGLTIAKTCVEACGGTISLENISPTGLRATITLKAVGAA